MDYTSSDAFVTHSATGHRRHQDTAPVTTEWSANDGNMLIWSLMEFVRSAGLSGVAFDPDVPDTYTRLKSALDAIYATKAAVSTVTDQLDRYKTVSDFGASPSATVAVNTNAFNLANAWAILHNVPVIIPPIGAFTIGRLAPVVGQLTWVGLDKMSSIVRVDAANWPYAGSSAPVLAVTGSFRAVNVGIDQNWIYATRGSSAGYEDGVNPIRWGGNWFVTATCTTTDVFEFEGCHFWNAQRMALSIAADPSAGGASRVKMTNCSGTCLLSAPQTILAAEAALSFTAENNRDLVAPRWWEGVSMANGGSVFVPWNCKNVAIKNNTLIGFQLVCRGPSTNRWTGTTTYPAGTEYVYGGNAYRVTSPYTSGTTFGALDEARAIHIASVMKRIEVCVNKIDSPIADTAIYGWEECNVDGNQVSNSGDMGIATSGSSYLSVCHNIINGTRVGGIDISYGSVAVVTGNIVKDIARASATFGAVNYGRLDVFGRFASTGGFALAAVTVNAAALPASSNLVLSGNTCVFSELPPESDAVGPVRANVFGVFNQASSNASYQNTAATVGNFVQDNGGATPKFFVVTPSLRFNASAKTGVPVPGEVFSAGATKWIYLSDYGPTGFVFLRKLTGALVLPINTVFTGEESGATITTSLAPTTLFLGCTEAANNDRTSRLLA